MKCQNPNCKNKEKIFLEEELECSHDVPKYLGGTDKDGRHWLCKGCHHFYEVSLFSYITMNLKENIKIGMREGCKSFTNKFFREVKNDPNTT